MSNCNVWILSSYSTISYDVLIFTPNLLMDTERWVHYPAPFVCLRGIQIASRLAMDCS